MVPGLAADGRSAAELLESVGRRADERELPFFGQHQQHLGIRQQHELTAAVAASLPLARAVRQVDAREDRAVEAERVAFVADEVVELRLQAVRGSALRDRTLNGGVRRRAAARAAPFV